MLLSCLKCFVFFLFPKASIRQENNIYARSWEGGHGRYLHVSFSTQILILPSECPSWSVHSVTPLSCQPLTHSRRYQINVCSQQGYFVRRTGKRLENASQLSEAARREEATTSDMLLE